MLKKIREFGSQVLKLFISFCLSRLKNLKRYAFRKLIGQKPYLTLPFYFLWIGIGLAIVDVCLALYLKPRGWQIWGIDWELTRILTRGLFIVGCVFTMVAARKTESEQDIMLKIRNNNFRLVLLWLCSYISLMPIMDWKFGGIPTDYDPYVLVITTTIMFHILFFVQWMAYKLLNTNEDKLIINDELIESRESKA